jgi:hypothetical protein
MTHTKDKSSPGNKYVVLLSEFDDIHSNQSLKLVLFPTQKKKIILKGKARGLSGYEKMEIATLSLGHAPGCNNTIHKIATLPIPNKWTNFELDLGKCAQYANYLQICISIEKTRKTIDERRDLKLALDDLRIEGTKFMVKPAPPRKIIVKKLKTPNDSLFTVKSGERLSEKQIAARLNYCQYPDQLAKAVEEMRNAADPDTLYFELNKFWKKSLLSKKLSYRKYKMLIALNPDWQITMTNKMIDVKKMMRNRIKIDDAYYGIVQKALYYNKTIFLLLKKDGYMRVASMEPDSGKIKIINQVKESNSEFEYFHYNPQLCFFSISESNAYINTKKNEFYIIPLGKGTPKKLKNWPGRRVSYVSSLGEKLYIVVDQKVLMSSDFDGKNRKLLASLKRDIPTNDIEKALLRFGMLTKIFPNQKANGLYIIAGSGSAQVIRYFPKDNKISKVKDFPFVDLTGEKKLFSEIIDYNIHMTISGGSDSQCLVYDTINAEVKSLPQINVRSMKQFFLRSNDIYYNCADNQVGGSGTSSCSGIYNYKQPVESPKLFLPTAVAIYPHPDGKSFYLIGGDIILKIKHKE